MLDHPIWVALHGTQRTFGRVSGAACRYEPDVCPFGALDPAALAAGGAALARAWRDLAAVTGPGGSIGLVAPAGEVPDVPPGWTVLRAGDGLQMTGESVDGRPDPAAEALGPGDAGQMAALVESARPGPFLPRTVHLGGYVGRRAGGGLVAMAGVRMRPAGFAEISAVATDPTWRTRGLATALVRHLVASVRDAGDVPFLHAAGTNTGAIDLYHRLGFTDRRTVTFVRLQSPPLPR
ncbi:MAG: GNAT family N-acetyltransferase [Acidimicrobiales bacterium]